VIDAIAGQNWKSEHLTMSNEIRSCPFTMEKRNERATGIEPAWPAWKAGTLPLSYARAFLELKK
jgi:hypothetical protein